MPKRCDAVSLTISEVLDRRRRVLGLTQDALARRMGRDPGGLSLTLDGASARTSTYAKMLDALDIDLVVHVKPRSARA